VGRWVSTPCAASPGRGRGAGPPAPRPAHHRAAPPYLDAMRNAYAQTAVPPYAVRARPGATVAAPWTGARSKTARCALAGSLSAPSSTASSRQSIPGRTCAAAAARSPAHKRLNAPIDEGRLPRTHRRTWCRQRAQYFSSRGRPRARGGGVADGRLRRRRHRACTAASGPHRPPTPLGLALLRADCPWFKDWYFPEGGRDGGTKLQGALLLDEQRRSRGRRGAGRPAPRIPGPGRRGRGGRRHAREALGLLGGWSSRPGQPAWRPGCSEQGPLSRRQVGRWKGDRADDALGLRAQSARRQAFIRRMA
jgi:hypothetical protein